MANSDLVTVANLVQDIWAPLAMDELRANLLLANMVNKEYDGQINKQNDTVKVSVIQKIAGQTLATSPGPVAFTPAAISNIQVSVTADKCFIASVEIDDIVDLQSQINKDEPKLRQALVYGMLEQINTHLYSKVSASTAAPDHRLESIATLDNTQLLAIRELAAAANWGQGPKYGLVSPGYYSDILSASTLVSSDFVTDKPVVGGVLGAKRYGFEIFEDSTLSSDRAIFFHPDFLIFVSQNQPVFKLSDKHSSKELGYVLSMHMYGGAALSPQGAVKHISVSTAAGAWTQ